MRRRGARVPVGVEISSSSPRSPADAYLESFQQAMQGIDLACLTTEPRMLTRLAEAFRVAERRAAIVAREGWQFDSSGARIIASECSAAAGAWLLGGDHDPRPLRAAVHHAWELARWTVRIEIRTVVVRGRWLPWERTRPVLVVSLPGTLDEDASRGLVSALREYGGSRAFLGMIVDASHLREMDAAGLGALARIVRFARQTSGRRPVLRNASPLITAYMRGVHLLRFFDVEPEVKACRVIPAQAHAVDEGFQAGQAPATGRCAARGRKKWMRMLIIATTLMSAAVTAFLL